MYHLHLNRLANLLPFQMIELKPVPTTSELPFGYHLPTVVETVYDVYNHSSSGGSMPSPVLSFRTDEEMLSKLDQLAEATERDRQYHLKRALSRYLDAELWHLQAIAEGIADADANNLTDLNSVKEKWVKRAENSPD